MSSPVPSPVPAGTEAARSLERARVALDAAMECIEGDQDKYSRWTGRHISPWALHRRLLEVSAFLSRAAALAAVVSSSPATPEGECEQCEGSGVVECWNPGGPCPEPNAPDCDTCGSCNRCPAPSPASPAETREGREAGLECLTCGAPKGVACDDAPEQQHELKALAREFGVMGA